MRLPKFIIVKNRKGSPSTTERMWVSNDSLTNLKRLKIQSTPFKIPQKWGYKGQIGTQSDWYRVNKVWVNSSGVTGTNMGDIYISPLGANTTDGVPDANNTVGAILAGYGNSTSGLFSVATNRRFEYTNGNFWVDPSKDIALHEIFYQDFSGGGDTANMSKYEVGIYPSITTSFSYYGAAPYTAKTDIQVSCYTASGTADKLTYYVEYALIDANAVNIPPGM